MSNFLLTQCLKWHEFLPVSFTMLYSKLHILIKLNNIDVKFISFNRQKIDHSNDAYLWYRKFYICSDTSAFYEHKNEPFCKIFYWPFQGGPPVKCFTDRSKAVLLLWIVYVFSVLSLLCLCTRLFICALWSPAWKWLTSWLSFVVSYGEFVAFPLLSWVMCGAWLYRFLIFPSLLNLYNYF